jgi:hypothetical protein
VSRDGGIAKEAVVKRLAFALAVLVSLPSGAVLAAVPPLQNETIPPNCTMDPWTGKLTCHIWPTCTIDPWTGKMNCPVPRLAPLQLR